MSQEDKDEFYSIARALPPKPIWEPFPNSPQEQAYNSQANEIYYGGACGGGKSALGIGLALTKHRKSLLLRRQAVNVKNLTDELRKFTVGTNPRMRLSGHGGDMETEDGRSIEVGGCEHEDDKYKYQGRPHDLIFYDEAVHFSRSQVRFCSAWNRHEDQNQLCQVILASNPPTNPEGRWIVEEFAPWLDLEFPGIKAEPGELRWFTMLDDVLTWVDGPEPFTHKGEVIKPRSRTFIPARLEDNPILSATGYREVLQSLPEPLRSQMLFGDMNAGLDDDPWQVIPTAWIRAAMKRWIKDKPKGQKQTSIGVDVARGGCFDDLTEILTDRGWKLFHSLSGNEKVLTLNGDIAEWGNITQIHKYYFDGNLNLHDGIRVNFCVTDNHNMIVRSNFSSTNYTLRQFSELPSGFAIKGTNSWSGVNPQTIIFKMNKVMPNGGTHKREWVFNFEDWARFLGWYVSEGWTYKSKKNGKCYVEICQRNTTKMIEIQTLLKKMGLKFRCVDQENVSFSNSEIGDHLLEHCKHLARNKRVPVYIKEAKTEIIEAFVDSYCKGDGTKTKTGCMVFHTTSRLLADDLQEILIKLGCAGKVTVNTDCVGKLVNIEARKFIRRSIAYTVCHRVRKADRFVVGRKVKKLAYSGYVYCVSTPNKTIMVRRKGCPLWSGNSNKTTICKKYGSYFDKLIKIPGAKTPDGPSVATLVIKEHEDDSVVNVDVVGVGSSAYDYLKDQPFLRSKVMGINNSMKTSWRDKSKKLGFVNVRAASYWKLREDLDPANEVQLDLPSDNELLSDLAAPHYTVQANGIKIEPKEDIIERIGRSPDVGDSVVLANWSGRLTTTQFQILGNRLPKYKGLKIAVVNQEELGRIPFLEDKVLLVVFRDPKVRGVPEKLDGVEGRLTLPNHSILKLLDSKVMEFADLDPSKHQATWDQPVEPWGKKVEDLVLHQYKAKELWHFLTKKRPDPATLYIFVDDGGRAMSTALGIAEALRLSKKEQIWLPGKDEFSLDPPNRHVFQVIKTTRSSVV